LNDKGIMEKKTKRVLLIFNRKFWVWKIK
jgi:hypothetical protein